MSNYSYSEFLKALEYLVDEGYIEKFYDTNGEECYRICEGAENCEI